MATKKVQIRGATVDAAEKSHADPTASVNRPIKVTITRNSQSIKLNALEIANGYKKVTEEEAKRQSRKRFKSTGISLAQGGSPGLKKK